MGNLILKITALIFGIALWFLVISQKDFQLSVEVPLNFVKLPETMAIASKPPHTLHITVEGRSWDLIRLQQILRVPKQNSIAMIVDMQQSELGPTRIHLDGKNFVAAGFPDIHFVEPENQLMFVDLDIDTRITRNVPIKVAATFNAAQGYLIANTPKVSPEEVVVSGARNALTRIIDIPTDSTFYDTLRTNQEFTIPLDFATLPAFVKPSDSLVSISIDVQKMNSKTYNDIPVNLIGFFDRDSFSLEPKQLSVEITGGALALDSITSQNIELLMEFNRFAIEDADSLSPTVKLSLPAHINREMAIKAIQLKPEKLTWQKKTAASANPTDNADEVAP